MNVRDDRAPAGLRHCRQEPHELAPITFHRTRRLRSGTMSVFSDDANAKHPARGAMRRHLESNRDAIVESAPPQPISEPGPPAGNPIALSKEAIRWPIAEPDAEFPRSPAREGRSPDPATRTARGAGSTPMPGNPARSDHRGTLVERPAPRRFPRWTDWVVAMTDRSAIGPRAGCASGVLPELCQSRRPEARRRFPERSRLSPTGAPLSDGASKTAEVQT